MKVGIIALGSHEEMHGAALPMDTDAKIAEFIAREVANRTDADFLGTLDSAYELPEIDTGNHQPLDVLKGELRGELENAKSNGFEGVVLVNAHGGNQVLDEHLDRIEKDTEVRVDMDSTVCKIEGPHAGTGELSIGSVIGIVDESKLEEHADLENHPEIGFVGFEKAQEKYDWAKEHANQVRKEGIGVDEELGERLIESAVEGGVKRVLEMKSG